MKVFKKLFDSITCPEALFAAWYVFKEDKRKKPDVLRFEKRLEQNIFSLHRDLVGVIYRHGPYKPFWLYDPKRRRIHKAAVRDRILHHAVFAALNPVFGPTFIPASFSCRVGKGTHKGVDFLADAIRKVSRNYTRRCLVLKCDIQKFFDSVDHAILLQILERKVRDKKVRWLLREIVGSFSSEASLRERERERE